MGPSTPLLSPELLQRYRDKYRTSFNGHRPPGTSSPVPTHPTSSMPPPPLLDRNLTDDSYESAAPGVAGGWAADGQASEPSGATHTSPTVGGSSSTGGAATSSSASTAPFVVRALNVMNPLDTGDNLVGPTMSRRRALRVRQLLQIGARTLKPVLLRYQDELRRQGLDGPSLIAAEGVGPMEAGGGGGAGGAGGAGGGGGGGSMPVSLGSVTLLDNFFTHTLSRFAKGWRPDVPNSGAATASGSTKPSTSATATALAGDLPKLQEQLQYCSLLLESEVTEPALRALSVEILAERGPLPVGEIGKLLQEATANPSLSSTLKDKFGGLKKFLEKYSEDFFISNNHPFNPHVYLKSTLSSEDVAFINSGGGLAPGQSKKSRKVRRRRR